MSIKDININTVETVAIALEELRQKMVFVGGAILSLYADIEAPDEARPTVDIDMTIQLAGFAEWTRLQETLTRLGFSPNPEGHAICSYLYKGIEVDIMPSEDGPIGKANTWYKPGFRYVRETRLENISVNILSTPYFLASKFEAFHNRGGEYRTSYDFEDIVYVMDNRKNIAEEILASDNRVKKFLCEEFTRIVSDPYSEEIIRVHLDPHFADQRLQFVRDKLEQILSGCRYQ